MATSLQPSPSKIVRVWTRAGPMLTALCRMGRVAFGETAISISLSIKDFLLITELLHYTSVKKTNHQKVCKVVGFILQISTP